MTESNQKSTSTKQKQAGLWAAGVFATVSLLFFIFALYNVFALLDGQFDTASRIFISVTAITFVVSAASFMVIRRGQETTGATILFSLVILSSVAVSFWVEMGGLIAAVYLILASLLMLWLLPHSSIKTASILAGVGFVIIIIVEIWNPAFRVDAELLPNFTVFGSAFAGTILFLMFAIQMWTSERLRNRIIALMLIVLLPILLLYSYISISAQQQDLEQALLDRAKAAATTGAVAIGASLEDAINSGQLTTDEVFDQNYIKFFEIDPANYPELTDEPRIYNKYNTLYDSYTDKHWQKLFDSYLTDNDIIYATASDINGYVPTHNTILSTGDGDLGTDRTKRIFDDAIGITAARNTQPTLQQVYVQTGTGQTLWDVSAPIYVNGKHWGGIRIGVQLGQNQARVQDATFRALITSSIFLLIVVIFAWALGTYITNPIEKLTRVAQAASSGDLETQIDIPNRDEITTLAKAFNLMTSQLREFIEALEQRVDERTRALTTVSEIGAAASTILEIDKLLQEVVTVSKERFDLYHAHIYLLDDAGENLVLASGAGEPGRQMVAQGRSIPVAQEKSLVARAAREREGVTVNDVTQEPDFLPNPLLPDTHSELAVPMMVGEKVIGVFDVQSDVVGRFTEADIAVQTTLASQIASAVQNARSYTEVQRSQALLSDALKVARIGNWEYDLEKDLFTFNEHFYSIFRTSVEQVGGYKISSADYARIFVHPDDAALVGAEIQRSIESKERFFQANLEHRIIFADGEIGYITVNINLERDEDGKIIRWYGANQDVTERRQLEEITRGRAKREESLNRITQKIQGTTTMAEALQVVARELGHALGNKSTLVMLDPDAMPDKSLTFQGAADSVPNPETT